MNIESHWPEGFTVSWILDKRKKINVGIERVIKKFDLIMMKKDDFDDTSRDYF